ncbi:MAG: hypothetical protein IPM29_08650 [Planctomycetes bacterium]|nr:hypothetical protein [Planctomycetota bacterium]
MRKKTWKILGVTLGLGALLLLLFVVAFVYNPFEGSLADIRELVPRNVEWFVRKADLREDFKEFPEPLFWSDFERSPSWQVLQRGELVTDLDRDAHLEQALGDLRRLDRQLSDSTGGFITLLGDLIGEDVIVAGRLRPPALENASFCAYLRVSWQIRFGWGLLDFLGTDAFKGAPPMQWRPDGTLVVSPPDGSAPMYVARQLDCLMVSNDEQLLQESVDLARGRSQLESFASSAYYRDEIRGRLAEWSEQHNGETPDAVELFLRTEKLFQFTQFDDGWPDPRHTTNINQRVLASFLRLDGWRFLSASLLFDKRGGFDGSVTLLGHLGLNQTVHTNFQAEFFKAEADDRQHWLDPFLRMVPADAVAAAALRVQAGDFLQEMLRALDPELRRGIDEQIQRTGQYDSMSALLDDLEIALLPRLGAVFQRPDPNAKVSTFDTFEPSPAPHVAWVFWIDDRFRNKVDKLFDFFARFYETLGFKGAYDLNVGVDAAREYANPNIPGTGGIAILIYREFLVLSNSGPLIAALMDARLNARSIMDAQSSDYRIIEPDLSTKLNGFVFVQGDRLVEVEEDYVRFLEANSANPDEGWMMTERPRVEREVLRQRFPGSSSVASLSPAQREQFETAVVDALRSQWVGVRDQVIGGERSSHEQTIALARLFSSVFVQFRFAPDTLEWKARALMNYR